MEYDFQNHVELRHDRKLLNWAKIFVTVTQCENLAFFLRIQQNIVEKDIGLIYLLLKIMYIDTSKYKCIYTSVFMLPDIDDRSFHHKS